MAENTALKSYLMTRRSVGQAFLREPGPDAGQLEELLTIATRVPDHGKLAPWRLVVFEGAARERAGERLAEIVEAREPAADAARLDIERRQFLPAPLVVGVLSTAKEHPKIPQFEQLISAGNVAFNLVHAAYALGFAASWVTRWFAYDEEAAAMLGAAPGERFVGFVHIGTPATAIEDRPRPVLGDIVTRWNG
ncbi:NAD(P)H nitroreductase [Devosia geojensis]|uniref:Putative NAD(P)H nitroreductase n=1 Tax=Devosia geojensis TaxID=443610 RepID=A0A0F5FT49_9HYPH|nr:nitroreductase [Devosia geojensis]KKB12024.1 NAD(P)H nitroreductase [Devosia geojensis]